MKEKKSYGLNIIKGGILQRLLTSFLILTLFSTAIVIILHVSLEYDHEHDRIESSVNYIKDSYIDLLVNNVWHLDEEEVEIALQGILNQPQITYVRIEASNITSRSFGVANKDLDKVFIIPLIIEGSEIGKLFLHSDTGKIYDLLKDKSFFIFLLPEIFKIMLITFLILYIVNKQLIKPLLEIVTFSKKIDISNRDGIFLRIPEDNSLEFKKLSESLNSLKTNAQTAYFELADYKNQLENLVEKRTKQYHEALLEAQQAALSKSQFLSNMSHELRTPLNSIILLSRLLKKNNQKNLSADDIKKADVINSAGGDLLSLINDILDLSKIESKKMPVIPEEFDVIDFCNGQVDQFRHLARDKGVRLSFSGPEKDIIINDRSKLAQVVKNLLSNALKFTNKGEVELKFLRVNDLKYAFEVHDTGIGIPEELHEIIFDKFEQGNKDILKNFGGTGLGLNITKNIIKILGGEIILNSTPDVGSCFRVELLDLEVNNVEHPLINGKESSSHQKYNFDEKELKGKNIYIVDDDERNLFSLKQLLETYNANVFCFMNGREILSELKSGSIEDIDLFVLDLMMPDLDGTEIFQKLREIKAIEKVPVIILTASTDIESQKKCIDIGVNDFLNKPIDPDLLLSRMLKVMSSAN